MVDNNEYQRLRGLVSKWTKLVKMANSPSLKAQASAQLEKHKEAEKQLFRDDYQTVRSKE